MPSDCASCGKEVGTILSHAYNCVICEQNCCDDCSKNPASSFQWSHVVCGVCWNFINQPPIESDGLTSAVHEFAIAAAMLSAVRSRACEMTKNHQRDVKELKSAQRIDDLSQTATSSVAAVGSAVAITGGILSLIPVPGPQLIGIPLAAIGAGISALCGVGALTSSATTYGKQKQHRDVVHVLSHLLPIVTARVQKTAAVLRRACIDTTVLEADLIPRSALSISSAAAAACDIVAVGRIIDAVDDPIRVSAAVAAARAPVLERFIPVAGASRAICSLGVGLSVVTLGASIASAAMAARSLKQGSVPAVVKDLERVAEVAKGLPQLTDADLECNDWCGDDCCVCICAPVTAIAIPCGHMLCGPCMHEIRLRSGRCPLCRAQLFRAVRFRDAPVCCVPETTAASKEMMGECDTS